MMPDESYPWWIVVTVTAILLMLLTAAFAPIWAYALVLVEFGVVVVRKLRNER
ncbi:MAG: hypothetical protein U0992_04670 [Planctomycetaceae bacterium]